ncbi:MAG TPA: ROK family transcriptional regulator [Spirochaetia bacterium]|nr:ROK family transcriptional regulator [Spirochaetia bacterium]HRZ63786.1 ROK family transcriptional regulator [Spirochaetia bacterium]
MLELEEKDPANQSTTPGRIFKIIRDSGPLYANDIVRRSGLAKSTVSAYVDKLLSVGLLREDIPEGGKRRKLKVAESAGYVVGIALGQSHLDVALCDLEAETIDSRCCPVSLLRESPEEVLGKAVAFARELEESAGLGPQALFGVGIGLPSPVDYANGVPVNPPVMPGWDRYPVASFLAQEFTCPVFVDNDVNVMALAERDKGAATGIVGRRGSFILVKAGTGIGAGLVIDGEIYRGAKGAAGDIGHIGIDGDETLCPCGNRGCLEAVAGGRALLARAEAAAGSGRSPFLAAELAAGSPIAPALVAKGAASGDEECIRLVISSGASIGDILAKLVNFFNPSLIVVSGGLTGLGERFIASIRESIYRRSTPLAAADLVVKKSALPGGGGTTGAAILVLDEVFSHRNVGRLMRGLA